jgi:hypothetical protein
MQMLKLLFLFQRRSRYMKLCICIFFAFLSSSVCGQPSTDSVSNAFQLFRESALSSDGSYALHMASGSTKSYFDNIAKLAMHADSVTIRNLTIVDRLHVLLVRHMFLFAEVDAASSSGKLLKLVVERGVIVKPNIVSMEIEIPVVTGEEAFARVRGAGENETLRFAREQSGWKVDFPSIFKSSQSALQIFFLTSDLSEEDFISRTLKNISGRQPDGRIWKRMKS